MSIKGIDAQIMVSRTTEYMKDSFSQLKKNELAQDFLAAQAAATEELEKSMPMKTQEAEQAELHLHEDGSSSSAGGSRRGRHEKKAEDGEDEEDAGRLVPRGNNIIDIVV